MAYQCNRAGAVIIGSQLLQIVRLESNNYQILQIYLTIWLTLKQLNA